MDIKERVRKGELSPETALASLKNPEISPGIVNWLKTTGKERYRLALLEKKKKQQEETVEVKEKPKKSAKEKDSHKSKSKTK